MKDAFSWMSRCRFTLLLALIAAATLLMSGCGGSDSYTEPQVATNAPVSGAATAALVEPATLKSWMDQGLVNNEDGFNKKVVILDFGSYALDPEKDPERIREACRVKKADLEAPRLEGVALANPLVATGEQMDTVLQRLGIDKDTTIVFTTSSASYFPTRAYWTFRYWGFPKKQLKLLNGGNAAFAADFPELMTREVPTPAPTTFSVRNLTGTQPDLRASVGEMIEVVKTLPSATALVLDARGRDSAAGPSGYFGTSATPGLLTSGTVVVFDGHPQGGEYLNQGSLYQDGKFKTADEIRDLFADKGWEPGKLVTVYCTSGYSATPLFFALDAILDAPVQLFDGSWSQLGKYSSYAVAGGELPVGSPWSIDNYLHPGTRVYNGLQTAPLTIEALQLNEAAAAIPPFVDDNPDNDSDVNPLANQVEEADRLAVGTDQTVTLGAPVATATLGVLIDASTLQGWMNAGLLNAPAGSERVVLLDVTTADAYAKGHIPGAQLWNTAGQGVTRAEGPAPAVNMMIEAADMNARIQALGIDEHTTIVITSSQAASYFPSRAYFTFRYYGWPKSRLKVLNGFNGAWDQSALTSEATDLADSTLTVQQIANLQTDLRASLPELMDALRDGRGIPVDMRGDKSATGSTPGVFSDVADDYVVFEGTLKGGTSFDFLRFQVDPANGDRRFKSAAEIRAALKAVGLDGSEVVYSYCRTGYIASVGFLVLDGVLGWPVMTYDGSWSQWGKLSANASKGGQLPEGSPWAVDNATYMEVVNYNVDNTKKVEPLNPDSAVLNLLPSAPEANQVEKADADYSAAGGTESGGTGGPPTAVTPPAAGC